MKWGLEEIEPWTMLSLRYLASIAVCIFFIKFSWNIFRNVFWIGFLQFVIMLPCTVFVIQYTDGGITALLFKLYIPLAIIYACFSMKERPSAQTIAGIIIALIALFILKGAPAFTFLGLVISIPGIIAAVARDIAMRKVGKIPPVELIAYGATLGLPVVLAFTFLYEPYAIETIKHSNLWVVFTVTAYQAIAMSASIMIWQYLLRENPINQVLPYNLANPIPAVILGLFIAGQEINAALIIGGILILIGTGLHIFWGKK